MPAAINGFGADGDPDAIGPPAAAPPQETRTDCRRLD